MGITNRTIFRTLVAALAAVLSLAVVGLCQSDRPSRSDMPSFSAKATSIYEKKAVTSPDGKKRTSLTMVEADSNTTMHPAKVTMSTGRAHLSAGTDFGLDAEILWSPDSLAFSVTGSREGANGQYGTDVFLIHRDVLVKVELTRLLEEAFGHPVKCWWPEPPNVVAVRWLVASKKILVAAQIIHHSNCDSFGTFRTYEVDLAGPRIVAALDQLESKRLYGDDLGTELLDADDKCVRDPKSCWVNANHQ